MPGWLASLVGPDVTFWLEYLTNGAHRAFYASFGYTLAAALFGGVFAILFGLGGAALRRSRLLPVRAVGAGYALVVRGVPDVLFLLFFPLAFEQAVEWVIAQRVCTPENAGTGAWPPCPDANIFFSTAGYLAIACVSLGFVYGAFASSAIHGALNSVPKGQIEVRRDHDAARPGAAEPRLATDRRNARPGGRRAGSSATTPRPTATGPMPLVVSGGKPRRSRGTGAEP